MTETQTLAVARGRVVAHLARATNAQLATALTMAVEGHGDMRAIEREIRAEARRRVGAQANAAADAEHVAFNAEHGIEEGMTDEALDAVFDDLFARDVAMPRGEYAHLVAALTGAVRS